MPPKKAKAGKKKLSGSDDEEENVVPVDVRYDPEAIQMILRDLEARVEAKCVQIQKETEFMATSIQQAFHLELIKIPTQVKQMQLSVFREEYGESLEAVTRGAIMGRPAEPPRTSTKNTRNAAAAKQVFQTPVSRRGAPGAPPPSARNPRLGESILSQNGSPLGVFQTVVKAPKGGNAVVAPTPGVFVPLNTGEVIDMESIADLSEEQKQNALQEMQKMQLQMQNLMKRIERSTKA
jgi:hypothetical protein